MALAAPLARTAFALDPGLIYLNAAAMGPLPIVARDAALGALDAQMHRAVLGAVPFVDALAQTRAACAALIGADGDEVALVRNVAEGAATIAAALDLRPGDEVIVAREDFPSNLLPWLALQRRGVVVRVVGDGYGRTTPELVGAALTSRTRAIALSWIAFVDGYRHDLAAFARVARMGGAALCVDAIQGLGAFPIDVAALGIDALYSGGHKWLLGPAGMGLLYLRRERLSAAPVLAPGWLSVADPSQHLQAEHQSYAPTATRFEGGTQNLAGAAALRASVELLRDCGIARVAEHIVALTDRLIGGLDALGCTVISERASPHRSGIVTFRHPRLESIALGRRLGARGYVVTFRDTGVRVSPHGYTTSEEIDGFLEALEGEER